MFAMIPMLGAAAYAATDDVSSVSYVDAEGNQKSASAAKMTSGKLTEEWYYVDQSKWIENIWIPSEANNVVNLILCDDTNLGTNGISIHTGKTLRIWAQSTIAPRGNKDRDYKAYTDSNVHTGRLHTMKYGIRVHEDQTVEINGGAIHADTSEDGQAGIGGKDGHKAGNIIINGGDITAYGTTDAAGIGGGDEGKGGNITINGGNVWARSDDEDGAGIGGGKGKGSGNITINGGDIVAYGSEDAAGIGSGYDANDGRNNTIINISGGKVYAGGGNHGAGIGSGREGSRYAAKITISGGNIEARGGSRSAGIGGGDESGAGEIEITGSWTGNFNSKGQPTYTTNILAVGGSDAAGIGSGDNSDNEYGDENKIIIGKADGSIGGGNIKAVGGERGAGIGGGEDSPHGGIVEIYGSWVYGRLDNTNSRLPVYTTNVVATGGERGAGIGGGDEGGGGIGLDKSEGITINGGRVEATGGKYAAGIGSGDNSDDKHSGGVININGNPVPEIGADGKPVIGDDGKPKLWKDGTNHPVYTTYVTANGGEDGAGIGGGDYSESGNITINGACVEAKGLRRAAGIGGSCDAKANTITIKNNAYVQATGDYGAGIGTGAGELMKDYGVSSQNKETPDRIVGGTINLENANVIAVSVLGGAGIGGGIFGRADEINISGGKVAAQGGVTVGPGSVPWLYIAQVGGAAFIELEGNLAGQIANTAAGSGSPIGENAAGLFTAIGQAFSKAWNWIVNLFADEPDMIFYTGAGIGGGFCASGGDISISHNAVVQATAGILPPNWCLKAQVDASGADVDYENPDREHPACAIGEGGGVIQCKDYQEGTVHEYNYVQNVSITDYTNVNNNNVALVVTVPIELDAKLEGKEFKYTPVEGERIMLPAFMLNPDGEGLIYPGTESAQAYPVAVIRPMPAMYGVVYQANDSEEAPVKGKMETQTVMEETEFSLSENQFTREGYTFMGWNTAPDGSGTSYDDKATFKNGITDNLVLFAQWAKNPMITYYEKDKATLIARKEVEYGSTVELMSLDYFKGNNGEYYANWKYMDGENADQTVEVTTLENVTQDIVLYLDSDAPAADTVSITYLPNGGRGREYVQHTSTGRDPGLDNFIGLYSDYEIKPQDEDYADFLLNGYYVESWKNQDVFEGYEDTYNIGDKPYADKEAAELHNLTLLAQWAPVEYTVIFDKNVEHPSYESQYSGSMDPQTMTYDVKTTLTPNAFTRTGYNFVGWSKKEDGSGVRYRDEQSLKNLTTEKDGTVTLYAVWEKRELTVTFMGNGGELSDMTEEDISTDCYTQTGVIYDEWTDLNDNRFVREGYEFNGWNTVAEPNADNPGEFIRPSSNDGSCRIKETHSVVLYAQWKPINYKVSFRGNAPEGQTVDGTMDMQDMTYDAEASLTANAFTCTGYTFKGWNTAADGSGTSYQDKKTVKNLTTQKYQFLPQQGVVILYAQWEKETFPLTFHGNGGKLPNVTEGDDPIDTYSQTVTYNEPTVLDQNEFKRKGYDFIGWNTVAEPTEEDPGTSYTDMEEVQLTDIRDLYAQWTKAFDIKFNSQPENKGIISANPEQASEGRTVTITLDPAEYCQLKADTLKVISESGQEIEINGSDNTYTFLMPGEAVTVSAEFEWIPITSFRAPGKITIDEGETTDLGVSIHPKTANPNVIWTSRDESIATAAGFDTNKVHITGVEEGEVRVYCVSAIDETTRLWINVTVVHHHSLSHVEAKDATCTEPGISQEYWICDQGEYACGKAFSDSAATTEIDPKTVVIPALGTDPNQKGTDGTQVGPGASAACADKAITGMTSDSDPKGSVYNKLKLRSTKQTMSTITLNWSKPSKATKFVLYGNKCGKSYKMKKIGTYKGSSKKVITVAGKKIKKGTYYKFILVALDKNNSVVSTSKLSHIASKGGKVTNPKKVTVKKGKKAVSKVTVKKGKTVTVKNTVTKASKKLRLRTHRKVMYESSNKKIATVTSKGRIKGIKKGVCYVYAYAQNGVAKKIRVTIN